MKEKRKKLNFAVAVILYNPDSKIKKQIDIYKKQFDRIYLFDNSDSPEYNRYLADSTKVYHYYEGINKGVSYALNKIFEWAIEENIDYILTMDQDSRYDEFNILKMKKYIAERKSENIAIYCTNYGKLYVKEGREVESPLHISKKEIKNVNFCMTSGSFVNVKALKRIGALEDWFIGLVDYDLCASFVEKGYSIQMYGDSWFYQRVGKGTKDSRLNRIFRVVHHDKERYYYMIRNAFYFLKKYKKNKVLSNMVKKQIIRILFNLLFENNKIEKIKYCLKGYTDFIKNKKGQYFFNEKNNLEHLEEKKDKKIKVLQVLNKFSVGGAETFIMNAYRNIDRNKITFEFLLRSKTNNKDYLDEIKRNGDKVFITSSFTRNIFKNFKETKKIIMSGDYDVIHVHANALIYVYPIIIAKKADIPVRIMHSHNTTSPFGFMGKIVHYINRIYIHKFTTYYIACGQEAGKWMFGNKKFTVINNAIDINKFSYNQEFRNKIREAYVLNNKFVIGNVGRFIEQKNHKFLIEIFKEYSKINENARLLLVGEGALLNKIKNQVAEYNIADKVIFTGAKSNINELLSAMDIFVLPSLYEGLPFVLVEAQASGLDIIASDEVTKEVNVTGVIKYISLDSPKKEWIKKINEIANKKTNRNIKYRELEKYDIENTIKILEKVYLKSKIS